ncbi:MAG TPA: tryptophan-rich sensory protein [Leeuwenhoekiella sp.]|nr:tryptophan-rich sensory protein [Leeuwenhoekiella sp.]
MKKKLAVINLLSVIVVIAVNYTSQAFRWNDTTIGEMSARYNNLFTPAPYAFAIWGLIFLGLVAYSIFQIRRAFFSDRKSPFIIHTGYWFAAANLLNVFWVIAFTYDYIGLSVLIMLCILFSLLQVVVRTNMERWDAPIATIAFVWWPICIYSGWIAVATIANISAFLTKWDLKGSTLNQIVWTMVLITVAVFINVLMINLRNMREFAMVGAWALFAIFIRHHDIYNAIAYYALCGAIILVIAAGIHGYKNRATNPMEKLKRRLEMKK